MKKKVPRGSNHDTVQFGAAFSEKSKSLNIIKSSTNLQYSEF